MRRSCRGTTIESEFRLADVNLSPAFFDVKKLRAFNGEYIRALPPGEFARACGPWLQPPAAPWPPERFDPAVFAVLAPLAQTRVSLLSEITAMVDFAFLDDPAVEDASWAKAMKEPGGRGAGGGAGGLHVRALAGRAAAGRPGGDRRRIRHVAGQGPGAGPGRGHRADGRACRCSSRWRSWAGPRPCAACARPPAASAARGGRPPAIPPRNRPPGQKARALWLTGASQQPSAQAREASRGDTATR